ncbi:cilia- and flagella-associated protein HOATZ [Bombina bombina]|uniref:cilia- and flagella-associated protein HOATZ n=1 Tax=Bombina bombina TaxID=8345 RepID=UPI00235AADFD|nr:cilia- and flagella-associated protein HOATZ [Bombina bombina]
MQLQRHVTMAAGFIVTEAPGKLGTGYTVFAGSSERDVLCCKMFWKSVTLQPPLESRLVSGDMEQRLKAAGSPKLQRNEKADTYQHLLEGIKTECCLLEAQKEQYEEQRARYLQKAKRREDILELLKKQREERIKKEAVAQPFKPKHAQKEYREAQSGYDTETAMLEHIRDVQQLK